MFEPMYELPMFELMFEPMYELHVFHAVFPLLNDTDSLPWTEKKDLMLA